MSGTWDDLTSTWDDLPAYWDDAGASPAIPQTVGIIMNSGPNTATLDGADNTLELNAYDKDFSFDEDNTITLNADDNDVTIENEVT